MVFGKRGHLALGGLTFKENIVVPRSNVRRCMQEFPYLPTLQPKMGLQRVASKWFVCSDSTMMVAARFSSTEPSSPFPSQEFH